MKAELIKRFEDDIHVLERELNSELPKEIKCARELGDLRENAEYQAAKDRQSFVQARLSMLHKRVAELSLMNLDRIPQDRAGFGSTVHLLESGSQTVVYQLVLPEDARPGQGVDLDRVAHRPRGDGQGGRGRDRGADPQRHTRVRAREACHHSRRVSRRAL